VRCVARPSLGQKLVRGGVDEARVTLGWAPGSDAPFLVEASTSHRKCEPAVAERRATPGNGSPSWQLPASWNWQSAIGPQIWGEATSAKPPLPGSDEDRCNHEESDSIPRCSIPYSIRSYNLRRILIALCAVIAEMAFPGQVGTDISRNDRHPRVRLHLSRYLPSYCPRSRGLLYSQMPRIDFWMSATRTEAVILGWDAP
jgi:hypothetical protein